MKDQITSRGVTFRRPQGDERAEQSSIQNLTQQLGGVVYVLGTRRAICCGVCGAPNTDPSTRQSPGVPDLVIFLPPPPRAPERGAQLLMLEAKGRGGTLSVEQLEFRKQCLLAGVQHLVGGLDEFIRFLTTGGWARMAI